MTIEHEQTESYQLTEEELSALGLREHPFTEHAEDAYLYTDSQLEMTNNIIMEYLTNSATTIVLTGEDGVGKTTFLRKILRLGYQQYQFCTLRAGSDTDFDFIQNKIKQRWVLAEDSIQSSASDLSIENYVICYLREHTHAALIIDDAHLLNSSTLDRLFTLKHRIGLACPLSLGFILAGESTLKLGISELEESNPACTQVYQINVRPFTHEQTGHYIQHRLQAAGLENEILLDEPQVTEIYKASSGNARQIHENSIFALQNQCREGSLHDASGSHITIRNRKPRVPVFLLSILAVIAAGFYLNSRLNTDDSKEEVMVPLDKPLINEPTLSPIAQEAGKPSNEQTPSLPLPTPPITEINVGTLESSTLQLPEQPDADQSQQTTTLLSESLEVMDKKQLLDENEKLVEKSKVANNAEIETESNNTIATNTSSSTAKSLSSVTKQSIPKKSYGEVWLKELDSSSYTLQVVATKEVSQLESLIKKENLKDHYAYFGKSVNDSIIYVLVIGNYKTRDQALAAINSLSPSLKKNKPWPIPLKNVQQYLK